MAATVNWFERKGADIRLLLLIQPKASRNEWSGIHDERLRLRIKAPPVDGAANEQLCAFLAKQFGVGKRQVHIESGMSGRRKRVRIEGVSELPEPLVSLLKAP
ncbi:MAG: DUF167 family protein [Gammaproteobacteria bacterium]